MGKLPSFQFYPSDWSRDLEQHPLEIEGAWIRICCKLFWSEPRGSANFSLTQWARILHVGERKCKSIIDYLDNQKIANLLNQNGTITITSRRMVHDENIRKIRIEAGLKGGNPKLLSFQIKPVLDKQNLDNQKQTPSSSSSSSSSNTIQKHITLGEFTNVKLTEKELASLNDKFGEQGTNDRIEKLSCYIASKGKKYKSHYATILNWERMKVKSKEELEEEAHQRIVDNYKKHKEVKHEQANF